MAGGFIPVERLWPVGIDLEAHYALEQMLVFDNTEPLLDRLWEGKALHIEQVMAAAIISGDWKPRRTAGRPKSPGTRGKAFLLALDVSFFMAGGKAEKDAVSTVANAEAISEQTVRNAVKENDHLFVGSNRRRRPKRSE